jgi:predicted dehydrogenase/threonine dehydrogenase-like Zn-dependent dehydrogenase
MKQVLLRGGGATVEEVPAPGVGDRNILVRVHCSCISVGTESAGMAAAAVPLYKRAIRQPENVRLALQMVREQGVGRTIKRIRGMLAAGQPTGYSAAGEVTAVGPEVQGFAVGDRVACAGAGIANHAEYIDVPVNLAVPVPAGLSFEDACTVTLGAIALQGVRRTTPTLGETVLVVGLGILGQLTVQMLKANGCRVLGVDPDADRVQTALALGLDRGFSPSRDDVVTQVQWLTDGLGCDAAVVTAASSGSEIISQAMQACRKKGRVVLVGDVGLDLKREDFYKKELDFLVSTSYGPGRYDPHYEEGGQDYPLPYVRWTENRNMAAYLALLADGAVKLAPLRPVVFDIAQAQAAYQRLNDGIDKPLLALLRYPARQDAAQRSVRLSTAAVHTGKVRVALVGAGGFAQGVHLPNLVKMRDRFELRWIQSRTGASAKAVAKQYEVPFAGTDFEEVLADPHVDLVMIATRHHLHADLALRALRAGKHVFVEKPLALNEAELLSIEAFYAQGDDGGQPLLMTGFNRRFSPPVQRIKQLLEHRSGPMMISYRMNAGFLPPEHWVHGPEGGGRNIGEACHIYDLFNFLTGSEPVDVQAVAIHHAVGGTRRNENFSATVSFADGSVANLMYTSFGAKEHPKESMDVFFDGKVIVLDDYRKVLVSGSRASGWAAAASQKGQYEQLVALAQSLKGGKPWPVDLASQLATMRVAFRVESLLAER